ncbi:hypothetical protein ACFVJ4_40360 [Streptomyces sp. NPDC127178]|uniref:hypothetical protein n=1 Tax=unclassified Streptomyces TaxID=2593676 RepID=UPI0036273A8D
MSRKSSIVAPRGDRRRAVTVGLAAIGALATGLAVAPEASATDRTYETGPFYTYGYDVANKSNYTMRVTGATPDRIDYDLTSCPVFKHCQNEYYTTDTFEKRPVDGAILSPGHVDRWEENAPGSDWLGRTIRGGMVVKIRYALTDASGQPAGTVTIVTNQDERSHIRDTNCWLENSDATCDVRDQKQITITGGTPRPSTATASA